MVGGTKNFKIGVKNKKRKEISPVIHLFCSKSSDLQAGYAPQTYPCLGGNWLAMNEIVTGINLGYDFSSLGSHCVFMPFNAI